MTVTFSTLQRFNLIVLGVLAGLVLALAFGAKIPRLAIVAVIVFQLILRAYRDVRWGGEAGRRRIVSNAILSFVLVYLILSAQ